jgi:EAL domain-containing protein (putative c-di-GMP-specific phosphodiesterase class I)
VHFSENLARLKLRGYALAMDATPGPIHIDQPTHAHCSEIKLGHALVSKINTDSEVAQMVASVVRSAHRVGMSTCALGLETIADLDRVRALGIDLGQGAVIADSLPAAETLAWVEREERARSFKRVARARQRVG